MLLPALQVRRHAARAHEARLARLARRDALPVPAARVRRVPARVRARVAGRDGLDGFAGARQRQRALLRLALAVPVPVLVVVGVGVVGGRNGLLRGARLRRSRVRSLFRRGI